MKSRVITMLPVLAVMLAIFMFSAQNSDDSGNLSHRFVDILFFWKKNDASFNADHIVRKMAHFTIYTVLGFFSLFHIRYYKFSWKRSIIISLLFCFLYAATDEIHQIFISGRSGQFSDVLLDTSGALTGMLILCAASHIISRRKHIKE